MPMIPVDGDTGTRGVLGRDIQPTPHPADPADVLGAAFQQGNSVVSSLQAIRNSGPFAPDPTHNPLDTIKGTPYEQNHLDLFVGSRSEPETRSIMGRIDEEERQKQLLASSGLTGAVAMIVAGSLDPTMALPIGTAATAAREGYSFGRAAVRMGAAMGVQTAAQEGVLQATQETRPLSESLLNVGSATLLGGLIGEGATGLLAREGGLPAVAKALDRDRADISAHANPVGAAATDTRELKPVSAFGLEKVAADPIHRTLNRPFVSARRAMADLADVPTEVEQNLRGETTTSTGGPPLEVEGRITTHQTNVAVGDELTRQWQDLTFQGEKAPFLAKFRAQFGLMPMEGRLTFEQFKEHVSDALMNGDQHDIPQVKAAAEFIRSKTFDQWGPRAEQAIEGFKPAEQAEGEGYFPHSWDKQKIKENRPLFVNHLTDLYAGDQATKAAAKERISALNQPLQEIGEQVAKLQAKHERLLASRAKLEARTQERAGETVRQTDRAEGLDLKKMAHEDEIGALKDSLSLLRDLKARKSGPLSTAQQMASAALDRVSNKLREQKGKAGEAGRAADHNQSRLDTLLERSEYAQERQDIIESALETSDQARAYLRGEIEKELDAWQGKSTGEAKSSIAAREKYEIEAGIRFGEKHGVGAGRPEGPRLTSADSAVDKAVKHILESDREKSIEDLRNIAHETTDRILGSPDGRLPYDEFAGTPDFGPRPPGMPARGSLAGRLLKVPNSFARDWIERDVEKVVQTYMRTFMPDALLAERFGDVEMSEAFRKINDEHAAMSDKLKGQKDLKALDKQKDGAIEDLAGTRDRFRGLYNVPVTGAERRLGRISLAVRSANVPLSMGMSALSSLPDAAGAMFRWGMASAFGDGWGPFLKSVMTNRELAKEEMRQAKVMGIAIDTITAQRHHEFAGVTEPYRLGSPLERSLQWGADKFQIVNGLGPWTDMVKSITTAVSATNFLKAAEASVAGTATQKQLRVLGAANINPQMAERIAKQYRESGNTIDGVTLPNTAAWTDKEARRVFEGALAREANIAVVTPGLDKAFLFSDPLAAMLLQFKSFTAAAHTRILIANLQRRDASTLSGLVGSLGLGMLSYKLNSMTGGVATSDNPGDWIKEGMSRGNIFGWLEEANALSSKMTRGRLDAYRMTGSGKELSRYAGRSVLDQLLGPTAGKIERMAQVTGSAAARDWKQSDTHALRQLMVGQNLFYLRGLFNEVEAGANGAFGIPMKSN
jgi:hypothetical protein